MSGDVKPLDYVRLINGIAGVGAGVGVVLRRPSDRAGQPILRDGLDEWVLAVVGARGDLFEGILVESEFEVIYRIPVLYEGVPPG